MPPLDDLTPIRGQTPAIIPVVDVFRGVVVQAQGGRRDLYRPLQSQITPSCQPRIVADALLAVTGSEALYLADLDGIVDGQPNAQLLSDLRSLPARILLDAGIRSGEEDWLAWAESFPPGQLTWVVGTETATGPSVLDRLDHQARRGWPRPVLSVDLKQGQLLGCGPAWGAPSTNPNDIIRHVITTAVEAYGITEIILIDLARVGETTGPGTEGILAAAKDRHPHVRFYAGGGIRQREHVAALAQAGASALLLASVIHQGRLGDITGEASRGE